MQISKIIKSCGLVVLAVLFIVPFLSFNDISAQLVPEWIKNTVMWFGEDKISEDEFLNVVKYLIENNIIILDFEDDSEGLETTDQKSKVDYVIIPNGNNLLGNIGYYIPLNLNIKTGTTVVWQNDDANGHTVQSQDNDGNPTSDFNSNILQTSDTFEHKFEEVGEFTYYCTIHPWRVGIITVS